MPELTTRILGETDEPLHLRTATEHRAVVLAMASQAGRSLCIYTRALDPAVYDSAELAEAISRQVRNSRHAQVRILVRDTARAVREGHALLRLAQQIPSKVQVRVPGADHQDDGQAFVVADGSGFIRRPVAELYAGEANFHAPFAARKLLQYFDETWERASPDPDVRRLFL
ncbi:MAG: hypothetical protein M0R77_18215 [Gammaproteobacteria bacterium]|nr:hypothetical protein [Gammaproteobacteria bacterium]